MSDLKFMDALWLRLGLPCDVGHSNCDPSRQADPLGLHRLGCSGASGAHIRRHDDIVAVIANALIAADTNGFKVAREQHLSKDAVIQFRLGDVVLNLSGSRTFPDLTIANPFASARVAISRSAGSPAAAAAQAYDRMMREWASILRANGVSQGLDLTTLVPLAVTALGVWGEQSLGWLNRFSASAPLPLETFPGRPLPL